MIKAFCILTQLKLKPGFLQCQSGFSPTFSIGTDKENGKNGSRGNQPLQLIAD
jgi:hypothetical protein